MRLSVSALKISCRRRCPVYPVNLILFIMSAKPQIIVIDQARMGSTRLPGKVMKEVLDKPLLIYQIERLKRVKAVDRIVIATTTNKQDDLIAKTALECDVAVFRGSEEDVLNRYAEAAKEFQADIIVRITSDCPLIDPELIDSCLKQFLGNQTDYLSNTIEPTFPRGMDVEVFTFQALLTAEKNATRVPEREHVTPYLYQHPDIFKISHFKNSENLSKYRITVDTQEDFDLVKNLIEYLYPKDPQFNLEQIIRALQDHPEWVKINAEVKQKTDHIL